MLKLRYPISSELFTFVHALNRTIELALRRECNLSVVQYRALSCMRQAGELEEAAMERVLGISASQLSQALGKLAKRRYAVSRTHNGPAKIWKLTAKGNHAIEDADIVLVEACDQVFGPLGAELGNAIRAGSMLTNQRHGVVRIENGQFFAEHACFEAFLQAERFTEDSTQDFGLTQTEFRIMFELYLSGPTAKSALARKLVMAPSVVSDACRALASRGFIASVERAVDKRVHIVTLTEPGRQLTERCAVHVDDRGFEDLRPSSADERALYQRMADIFVHQA